MVSLRLWVAFFYLEKIWTLSTFLRYRVFISSLFHHSLWRKWSLCWRLLHWWTSVKDNSWDRSLVVGLFFFAICNWKRNWMWKRVHHIYMLRAVKLKTFIHKSSFPLFVFSGGLLRHPEFSEHDRKLGYPVQTDEGTVHRLRHRDGKPWDNNDDAHQRLLLLKGEAQSMHRDAMIQGCVLEVAWCRLVPLLWCHASVGLKKS